MQVQIKTNTIDLNLVVESQVDVDILLAVFNSIEKSAKNIVETNEIVGKADQ